MAADSVVDVLIVILSVLIVLANVIICLLVVTNKSLRTYTNGFLVSLAVSDILLGGLVFPVILTIPESIASGYLISVVLLSGVANHCCITFDRYIAVRHPFSYAYLPEKYFTKMLLIVWIVVVAFSLVPLCWNTDQTLPIHQGYIFVEIIVFIFIPYMLICIAYCLIFTKLREHFKLLKETNVSIPRREQTGRLATEAKVAKVCLILIAAFVLCWLPIIYMTSATAVGRFEIVPVILQTVSKFTLALSSLINPLLYSFKKDDFRNALKKIVTRNANGQIHPTATGNHIQTVQELNMTQCGTGLR